MVWFFSSPVWNQKLDLYGSHSVWDIQWFYDSVILNEAWVGHWVSLSCFAAAGSGCRTWLCSLFRHRNRWEEEAGAPTAWSGLGVEEGAWALVLRGENDPWCGCVAQKLHCAPCWGFCPAMCSRQLSKGGRIAVFMHLRLTKYSAVLTLWNQSTSIFSQSVCFKHWPMKMSTRMQFPRRWFLIHLEYHVMLQKAQLSKHKRRDLP